VKNLAISRRYAKALLLIGKEDGQAEMYRKELDGVTRLLEQEKMLSDALSNPLYNTQDRQGVLEAFIEKLKLSKTMASFLVLVFVKGRFGFINAINEYYQKMADELKGLAQASLVSASELTNETVEKIKTALSKRTGKQVVLDISVDPSLIGGMVTRIGDLVLDGSIKTQLEGLKESIKGSE
jgi:F-type H+-transporting ATPase subunit delta